MNRPLADCGRPWSGEGERAPRSTISADERALIDAALAAGRVTRLPAAVAEGVEVCGVAVPGHPEPMAYDPDKRSYGRGPRAGAAAGKGWL